MLKLKYKNINDDTTESFNEILALNLPIKEGIKIARISKKINEHIELKREFAGRLMEKYAEREPDGKIKPVKDEFGVIQPNQVYITDIEAYNKEHRELEDQDIELEGEKIDINVLGIDKIKPKILIKLDWLINLDEEVTETSKS